MSDHLNTDLDPAICGNNADPYLQGRRDLPCVRILPDTPHFCLSVFSLENNSSNSLSLGNADPYLQGRRSSLCQDTSRHVTSLLTLGSLCPTLPLDAPVNHLQVSSILISRTVRVDYRPAVYAFITWPHPILRWTTFDA